MKSVSILFYSVILLFILSNASISNEVSKETTTTFSESSTISNIKKISEDEVSLNKNSPILIENTDYANKEISDEMSSQVDSDEDVVESNDLFSELAIFFSKYFIEFLLTIIAAVISGLIVFSIQERLKKRMFMDIKIAKGQKKNSIMVVGLGGSGKTAIVNMLSQVENRKKVEETKDYSIFKSKIVENDNITYNIYISDYRGQDLGNLVRSFIIQQLTPNTPMRFGHVNSLILVVDLYPPKVDENGRENTLKKGTMSEYNKERIQEHLKQWNRTALDAVFGMHVSSSLKYICLFINKHEVLSDHSSEMTASIKNAYKELIDDMERRQYYYDENEHKHQYANFQLIIGSALDGEGTNQLREDIFKYSKPLSSDLQKRLEATE